MTLAHLTRPHCHAGRPARTGVSGRDRAGGRSGVEALIVDPDPDRWLEFGERAMMKIASETCGAGSRYARAMAAAQLVSAMSYAEYLDFEREAETKHEYVNGQVYAMAGGTAEHARLAMRLGAQFLQGLGGRPCEVFSADLRVRNLAT